MNSFLSTVLASTNVVFDCFLHHLSGHQIVGPAPCMSVECSRCCTCTCTNSNRQCVPEYLTPKNKVAEKMYPTAFSCVGDSACYTTSFFCEKSHLCVRPEHVNMSWTQGLFNRGCALLANRASFSADSRMETFINNIQDMFRT